jgi:hypothetical protein
MADSDPKPEATEEAEKPVRLVRAPNFRAAYANTFRVRLGNNDVGIAFGYQTEIPNQTVIQDEVEVVLTPAVFKFLSLALTGAVQNIEKVFGEIKLLPGMLDGLKVAAEEAEKETVEAKAALEKLQETKASD